MLNHDHQGEQLPYVSAGGKEFCLLVWLHIFHTMALKPFLIQFCCDCNKGFKIYQRITHKPRAYLYDPIFHSSSGLTETALLRADGQHEVQAQLCSHMCGIQWPENFSDSTATTCNVLLSSPKSKTLLSCSFLTEKAVSTHSLQFITSDGHPFQPSRPLILIPETEHSSKV